MKKEEYHDIAKKLHNIIRKINKLEKETLEQGKEEIRDDINNLIGEVKVNE